jgi:hypothetical protein
LGYCNVPGMRRQTTESHNYSETEFRKHAAGLTGPQPPTQGDERPPARRGQHAIPVLSAPETDDEVVQLVTTNVDVVAENVEAVAKCLIDSSCADERSGTHDHGHQS